MTTNYASSEDDDDFFESLDRSLTTKLSIVLQPNFISDLIEAINNLEDDIDDGFLFHDDDEYPNSYEWFTSELSDSDFHDEEQPVSLHQAENDKNSENGENVGVVNVSVDMFEDYQDDHEIIDVEPNCVDHRKINEQRSHSQHMSETLCDISIATTAKQNDEIFEEECPLLERSPRVQHAANPTSCQQLPLPQVPPIVENIESERLSESDDMVVCIPSSIVYDEPYANSGALIGHQGTQQSTIVRPVLTALTPERTEPGERMTSTSRDLLPTIYENVNSPSRSLSASFCGSSSVPLLRNTVLHERKECVASFCGFSSTGLLANVNALQQRNQYLDGNNTGSGLNTDVCNGYEVTRNLITQVPTIHQKVNSPSRRSLSASFCGFSSTGLLRNVNLLQQRKQCLAGNNNGSELSTTACDEYETRATQVNMTEARNFYMDESYTQSSQHQSENSNLERRQQFIDEIEKLILKINNDVISRRKLQITVPYKVAWDNCVLDNERLCLKPLANDMTRRIESKRRIGMIVYVLSFVYKLLISNAMCTKSDPKLTLSQSEVDNTVKDICLILNARPWELGILSSSKGLIAGSIKLTLNDDSIIDVGHFGGGILLPQKTTAIKKVETAAKFVLLVEKHTIYEKLLTDDVLNRLNPCILITGKGYPDINTRSILKKIWDDCKCPIYALVDADPYGIEIMLTYRYGSLNLSYCNDKLAIPSIRWIGVYPSEIKSLGLQQLTVTSEDIFRIDAMIKRPYISTKIHKEFLVLKTDKHKSEVEGLTTGGIADWIDSYLLKKINRGNFF